MSTNLRSIFDVYARSNRNTADELQDSMAMSIGEWLAMLEHVGLFEMGQVSYFGAKMIFKWFAACTRSRITDAQAGATRVRALH